MRKNIVLLIKAFVFFIIPEVFPFHESLAQPFTASARFLFATVIYTHDSTIHALQQLPDKYLSQVTNKSHRFEQQVSKQSKKALDQLIRQEKKMQAKMSKVDSVAAQHIFTGSIDSLNKLKTQVQQKASKALSTGNTWSGYLDTLQNSLQFLKEANGFTGQSKAVSDQLGSSLQSVNDLQSRMQQANQIKTYIRERKQQLKEQLTNYSGFTKDLQKYNKQAYYYGQQLKEYKALLKDKKKAEAKALELLQQIPAFKTFLQKHAQLAGLFNLPDNSNAIPNIEGLQTQTQVEQVIRQQISNGGPGAQATVQQQMGEAKERLNDLKNEFSNVDNAADMPDFKPNEMKSKSFLQRLEFGGNLQVQRASVFYPTTSDIAGQIAYKFHKNGSAGLGVAYKLGMGTGWNDIRFSHQGVGLRSFFDWKLKRTFFINGGFEENYNTSFTHVSQLQQYSQWQGSALFGLSKKYTISSRLKGNISLLYDFLYNQHVPRTDPLKFRLGYNF